MRIRTKEQFIDYINGDIAWRKKEMFTLRANVEKSSSKLVATAIRSGLVLLYAHWEGFIKCAAETYLLYVINQKYKYGELNTNFVAIAAKQKIQVFEQTNKATTHNQLIDFILNSHDDKLQISTDNVIKTQSNLNSVILREIIATIGLDFSVYETKSKLIDEQLLNYRNTVAHGQFLEVDVREYLALHEEVFKMMDIFKTDVENAVVLSIYLRK